ncbi:hypothetical protein, partial [Rivihabitans pingtungensis]|uniref:hypothetical protein n=1 Tax=Rivihabitans pingtungensis TaxID=1054498 RepID=UPI002813ABBA|nr:MarR family transcriptional regulator [Rivihabitans pingtungensis]
GMAKLLESRTRQMTKDYGERVEGAGKALAQRAKALADARSEEGYMAEVIKVKDGAVMLVENHCPICTAAEQCSGLCASELDVFRKVRM